MLITNSKLKSYKFLQNMYKDSYFPNFLVDKGVKILVHLCEKIEAEKELTDKKLYDMTHFSTEQFNQLAMKFYEYDSEIETVARDAICMDFDYINNAYNLGLDTEEMIAPRNW